MKTILTFFSIMTALVSFNLIAVAADLKPETMNGVTYVSGGVGMEEQESLRQMAGDYNLRLTFAARSNGEYLADVKVTILDSKGAEVLKTVADGPMLFARLSPGNYKVITDYGGKEYTRSIRVSTGHPVAETITWSNVRDIHCC
jgi:hypothetical protein